MKRICNSNRNPLRVSRKQHFCENSAGFALVSTNILLIILGFFVAVLSTVYVTYQKAEKHVINEEKIVTIQTALNEFIENEQRLPCPASLTADYDTVAYGKEVISYPGIPGCEAGTFAGTENVSGRGGERVVIGTIPARTLNLSDEYIMDSWGNKFVYAVTARFTGTNADFKKDTGAIYVRDRGGNEATSSSGNVIYTFYSPGQDRRGAYDKNGVMVEACDTSSFAGENCDFNDAVFHSSIEFSNSETSQSFTSQFAYMASADIYEWNVVYGSCTCPTKLRPAIITCHDSEGHTVSDSFCVSRRPDDDPMDCASASAVNDCFGWYTPPWGSCPCDSSITRTKTCNNRTLNGGSIVAASTAPDETMSCRREGDVTPDPLTETKTCSPCPPPPPPPGSGGGSDGGGGGGRDHYSAYDGGGNYVGSYDSYSAASSASSAAGGSGDAYGSSSGY